MSVDRVFELKGARVTLDQTVAVRDVDFSLESGEFLTLLGANGSGKTTLVRALLRLVPLTRGEARVFGLALNEFRDWGRFGYVPQRASGAAGGPASVMEVALSGRIACVRRLFPYGAKDRAAATSALDALGVGHLARLPIATLSGGQQQRVLIARALAGEPEVLVLDEPLSGVDIEHQERLSDVLREFRSQGGTVLLVAHGLGPMEALVTREVVMDAGTVVYDGPHLPHHVHLEHVHHPDGHITHSPLDRAAGAT